MKNIALLIFILSSFNSISQNDNVNLVFAQHNKELSTKISTQTFGILPFYLTANLDRDYNKKSNKEKVIIEKLDALMNEILSNELKIEFIKYSNINTKQLDHKIGWLTGALEHEQFSSKRGFPKRIIKTNAERYQIGLSVKSFHTYKNKRNFYSVFIFDKLKKRTIGYEQIITDYYPIDDYNKTSLIISHLIKSLNDLNLKR